MGDTEDSDDTRSQEGDSHRKERKRLFLSLGRLRKKYKSRSLTDLNKSEEKPSRNGTTVKESNATEGNTTEGITTGKTLKKQTTFDVGGNLVTSDDSQFINTTLEDEDVEADNFSCSEEVYEDLPAGTTAATLWKTGLCSFFALDVELKQGIGLIARDKSGTSDPYVKCKLSGKCVFKSRVIRKNLNPVWNEKFSVAVDDINTNLVLKVYDFDLVTSDDQMGVATICLADLEVSRTLEMKVDLINQSGFREDLGQLSLSICLTPKSPNEKVEFAKWMTSRNKQGSRSQVWDALLSVTLVEGIKLIPMDDNGFSDPYCRLKLGNEKHKSKTCKATLNPQWREQFDMKIFADTPMVLEITVWDKDTGKDEFMGRCHIELGSLEREKTHYIKKDLEDKAGTLVLYLGITALSIPGSISDLTTYTENSQLRISLEEKFSLKKTFKAIKEIGWVQIKLHRAVGLAVADLSGTSDPFAIIELNNQRVITPTLYKTLNPQWEKFYELPVFDIHDVLDITLYDEDKRGAPEFLGRVLIPLLSIEPLEKRLYQLKDKRLQLAAKGHLILTLDLIYNPIRASIRTFNPRQENVLYEPPRFRRQLLQHNVDRLQSLLRSFVATGQFVQSLFTWKYKLRSAFAFVLYILLVLNFDLFLLPLILLLVLLKNYVVFMLSPEKSAMSDEHDHMSPYHDDDEDDEEIGDDKTRKTKSKSIREKLEAVTTICTQVQNHLDNIAAFGERIKNIFNWTVPFCSYLLMVILMIGTIILYMIPIRYLLLAWGINKFTKRIRKPNAISNNEALDFLSRLPSDPEVKQRHRLKNDVVLR